MNSSNAFEILESALPVIAHATGGMALITDSEGRCLRAVNSEGERRRDLEDETIELCRAAAEQGRAMGRKEDPAAGGREEDPAAGDFYALPFGDLVLAASNERRAERERQLFETLKSTLPMIATVAGGEAVLFDGAGRRLLTANPNSQEVQKDSGTVSERCLVAIRTARAEIGPSRSVPGAMAVRIPISENFGFGFNNAVSVSQRQKLLEQVKSHRTARYTWEDIVHHGERLAPALELAKRAAAGNSSVLVLGESGTGKELFAQAIHNASPRADKPFIAINCAALPENLAESTFFGYVDGAFTGARRGGQAGLFEQADGGTLLLDEISETSPDLQAKLLRVLQEGEVRRLGANKAISVDVRIICTSNRDLVRCMDEGSFRTDLFYRLNVIDIYVPPLRHGREDIPYLAAAILDKLCRAEGWLMPEIHPDTLAAMMTYSWPGNVRELHNVLERALNLAQGNTLSPHHLPDKIVDQSAAAAPSIAASADVPPGRELGARLAETERRVLMEALERNGGNRAKTARELGISTTTLWRRLKRAGDQAFA